MVLTETSGGAFAHTVNKLYDNYQRLTDRKLDGLAVTNGHFVYDADGRLSQITQGSSSAYTINRAASNGLLAGTTMSVGTHSLNDAYEYNALGDITRYRATYDGTTIYNVTYTRDPASGRITGKSESIGPNGNLSSCSATYDYNDPNLPNTNFLHAQSGCTWGGTFSFDTDGNNLAAGTTFDAQDRVDPSGPYGYDADGDTTSLTSGWTYSYDVPGNLRRATYAPGVMTVDYVVDAKNRRRGYTGTGLSHASEGYVWDGGHIVGMEKPPWGVVGHFIYATKSNVPDLMYAPQGLTPWTPFRIISDPLGSVKMVVRVDNGAVYEWHDYSPWGAPVAGGGATFGYVPFGFAGGLYDSNTGLYRYGARDYNPWSGRWWSKDPIRFGGGLNMYAYCNDDPVNCIDPSGLAGTGLDDFLAGARADAIADHLHYWDDGLLSPSPTGQPFGPGQSGAMGPGDYCPSDGGGGSTPGASCRTGGPSSRALGGMCTEDPPSGTWEKCPYIDETDNQCIYLCNSDGELKYKPKSTPEPFGCDAYYYRLVSW